MSERRNTRTEELLRQGVRTLSKGGKAPFVKWGDEPCWLEGRILGRWESQYGPVLRIEVMAASENLTATTGTGKEKVEYPVLPAVDVSLSLSYKALRDALANVGDGRLIHVAFEGWSETRGGNTFRNFIVLDLSEEPLSPGTPSEVGDSDDQAEQNSMVADTAPAVETDLPF
ncbi:MAG: hypothetical protein ACE5JR_02035 [Gemmatimonadota bacterium]